MILHLPDDVGRASWVEIALTAAVTADAIPRRTVKANIG